MSQSQAFGYAKRAVLGLEAELADVQRRLAEAKARLQAVCSHPSVRCNHDPIDGAIYTCPACGAWDDRHGELAKRYAIAPHVLECWDRSAASTGWPDSRPSNDRDYQVGYGETDPRAPVL